MWRFSGWRRGQSGSFTLADYLALERLAELRESGAAEGALRTVAEALADRPRIAVGSCDAERLRHGQVVDLR